MIDILAWQGPPEIGTEYARLHALDPKTPENMQTHPLCIFFHGSAWQDVAKREAVLKAHEAWLDQLRRQGKLGAAGSIEAPDDMQGLVMFKAIPLEQARKFIDADPAVVAGVLRPELHTWWSADHVLPW